MITEEKIKQIRKQLRRGVPQGEIMTDLKREGYTEEDIEKIFVPFKSVTMRNWYLVFGIIFFIGGIFLFSLLLVAASAILLSMYYVETQKMKRENAG